MSTITVKQAILENFPFFKGIKVETSNDFNYLIAEKRIGHWIASLERARNQKYIIIVSTKEIGKLIFAKIINVRKSKEPKRIEIFFEKEKVKKLKIQNKTLLFSRNPVGYY
jgi:hypothetical protein